MKKFPFKKKSLTDTLVNVGIGGAANVVIDYVEQKFNVAKDGGTDTPLSATTVNLLKVAVGAIAGSMVSNPMARAAADGVAVVGVSNLISGLMSENGTNGLPKGTIAGPITPTNLGNQYFQKNAEKAGFTVTNSFIGK